METNRRISIYTEPDGKSPVFEFIRRLDQKLQKKIQSQLKQLQNPLFELQPPHVKAFRQSKHKGFYELRTRIRQAVRIIFILGDSGEIIILHGFIKNGNRATERALETARARQYALASSSATTQEFIFSSMEEHKNYEKKDPTYN